MLNIKLTLENNNYFYYTNVSKVLYNSDNNAFTYDNFITIIAERVFYNKTKYDSSELDRSSTSVIDRFLMDDKRTSARPREITFYYE